MLSPDYENRVQRRVGLLAKAKRHIETFTRRQAKIIDKDDKMPIIFNDLLGNLWLAQRVSPIFT